MIRLLARIDIRNGFHIKTVKCEGVSKLWPVGEALQRFSCGHYEHDELLLLDSVASLYGYPNWLLRQDEHRYCPIPLSIGGGIDSIDSAMETLSKGAEKVVLNTAAVENPSLLPNLAKVLGRQAVVLQIDAKKISGEYRCFTHGSRELAKHSVKNWINAAQDNGVGEVHLTSIDSEGTSAPFPDDLAELAKTNTPLPIIISGGIRSSEAISSFRKKFEIDAFSFSSFTNELHVSTAVIRQELLKLGEQVRLP